MVLRVSRRGPRRQTCQSLSFFYRYSVTRKITNEKAYVPSGTCFCPMHSRLGSVLTGGLTRELAKVCSSFAFGEGANVEDRSKDRICASQRWGRRIRHLRYRVAVCLPRNR